MQPSPIYNFLSLLVIRVKAEILCSHIPTTPATSGERSYTSSRDELCAYAYLLHLSPFVSSLARSMLTSHITHSGFIVSDWAAMINGVQPALAGLDMNMPGFVGYGVGDQVRFQFLAFFP
jgi:hypothetical protein